MTTSRPRSNFLAGFFVAVAAAAAAGGAIVDAFSPGPAFPPRARPATTRASTATEEETVTMRSLDFVVESRPLGIVLEELEEGGGVFAAEVDDEGAAYDAGIREGDILAGLDGDGAILSTSLDGALSRLERAALPLPVRVYRMMDDDNIGDLLSGAGGGGKKTVKMAPRRLPSTKKLIRASTNANFWKDPLMMGSAVLTVAMPLGIFLASKALE